MTIFRTNHSKNYTIVNNTICTDNRISFKAKGIWLYAFSRPDDWTFYLKDIVNQSKDGEDSVRSGLKELEKYGYLVKAQNRTETGKYGHVDWEFFEVPRELKESVPKGENPHPVNPHPENPSLLSTEVLPSTERKQQQQAAKPAAALPKQEKKELKDPINVNLLYIEIPDSEKRWISEHYEDADIRHAVTWAQHSETKITSTLEQAIKWACKTKPEIPKEKISVYEELCKTFKHGEKYNNAECILNRQHFAFERGMKNEYVNLDEYFTWTRVKDICKNFGVNFRRK